MVRFVQEDEAEDGNRIAPSVIRIGKGGKIIRKSPEPINVTIPPSTSPFHRGTEFIAPGIGVIPIPHGAMSGQKIQVEVTGPGQIRVEGLRGQPTRPQSSQVTGDKWKAATKAVIAPTTLAASSATAPRQATAAQVAHVWQAAVGSGVHVGTAIGGAIGNSVQVGTVIGSAISGSGMQVGTAIGSGVQGGLTSVGQGIGGGVSTVGGSIGTGLGNTIGGGNAGVASSLSSAGGGIGGGLTKIGGGIGSGLSKIGSGIGGSLNKVSAGFEHF